MVTALSSFVAPSISPQHLMAPARFDLALGAPRSQLRSESFVAQCCFSIAEAISRGHDFERVNWAIPVRLVCGGRSGLYPAFPSFTSGDSPKVICNLPFAIRAI